VRRVYQRKLIRAGGGGPVLESGLHWRRDQDTDCSVHRHGARSIDVIGVRLLKSFLSSIGVSRVRKSSIVLVIIAQEVRFLGGSKR
jgi:hypothetical protein